ncbi:MAG: hypothetical protein JSW59_18115 [Phycisphaerales bacterium]|nr:MAG: hypothetical protein JSW59_18115 [Phycisphaerales bacterium]
MVQTVAQMLRLRKRGEMAGDFFFSKPRLSAWAPKKKESELRIVEGRVKADDSRVVRLAADLIGLVRAPVISISAPFSKK